MKNARQRRMHLRLVPTLALLFSLVAVNASYAQLAVGQWYSHLTHNGGQAVAVSPTHVYMLSELGLAGYNVASGEYREFSKVEGLSSVEVSSLHYDAPSNSFFVGYKNGIIDFFVSPNKIQTVRDISLSTTVTDKRINAFYSYNNVIYIAAAFGVAVFDPAKREVKASYTKIGDNLAYAAITDVVVFGGRIWVLTPKGPYSASLQSPNLADAAAWQSEVGQRGLPFLPSGYKLAASPTGFFVSQGDTVFRYDAQTDRFLSIRNGAVDELLADNANVLLISGIDIFRLDNQGATMLMNSDNPKGAAFLVDGSRLVVADGNKGLRIQQDGGWQDITPPSMGSNSCYRLAITPSHIYVAPNSLTPGFIPAYSPGAYALERASNQWKHIHTGILPTSMSICNVAVNPSNGHVFLSSWGRGIVELNGTELVQVYNQSNSTLVAEPGTNDVYVSQVDFDNRGILWASQFSFTSTTRPISARGTDGTWASFSLPTGLPNLVAGLQTDGNGYVWAPLFQNRLLVLDAKGTLTTPGDDRQRYLREGGGLGNLPDGTVNTLTEDRGGAIWVGTNNGIVVYYSSFNIFNASSSVDAVCPINTGQCLLRNEVVQTIAVDGANRKWVGTNRGLFLFNTDGTQLLAKFTSEDSPLFSDDIKDIEVDPVTGVVYIATGKGLLSFGGTATESGDECQELELYPNPAYADFDGSIAIRGTSDAAVVKITSSGGYLVADLPANGGMATWNGRDYQGNRVVPGIYIVHVAKADGSGSCVGKIAILPRQ